MIAAVTPEPQLVIAVTYRGREISISVEDNGRGIDRAHRDEIMKPFFTTKEIGSGTGLGLSIAKAIAKKNHSDVYLESPRQPTRFVLVAPAAKKPVGNGAGDPDFLKVSA